MKSFTYYPYKLEEFSRIRLYKGFINPAGEFYSCTEYIGEENMNYRDIHSPFSRKYCEEILGTDLEKQMTLFDGYEFKVNDNRFVPFSNYLPDKLAFVHIHGFIYFSSAVILANSPKIVLPNRIFNGKEFTREQESSLYEIWQLKKYSMDKLEEYLQHQTNDDQTIYGFGKIRYVPKGSKVL